MEPNSQDVVDRLLENLSRLGWVIKSEGDNFAYKPYSTAVGIKEASVRADVARSGMVPADLSNPTGRVDSIQRPYKGDVVTLTGCYESEGRNLLSILSLSMPVDAQDGLATGSQAVAMAFNENAHRIIESSYARRLYTGG